MIKHKINNLINKKLGKTYLAKIAKRKKNKSVLKYSRVQNEVLFILFLYFFFTVVDRFFYRNKMYVYWTY